MPKTKLGTKNNVVELAKKPAEMEAFIEWLATPAAERVPRSQAEFARKFNVTQQGLSMWKRDPRVITRVDAARRHATNVNDLPDVIDALTKQATDPSNPRSVQAAKVLMTWWDRTVDESEQIHVASLSDAELEELVIETYDEIRERRDAEGQ